MKVLRHLSILTALLFAMGSNPVMAVPIAATQNGSSIDGTLTADMLTGAKNVLVTDQSEQAIGATAFQLDTEVDYVIRELTVASDVLLLGFDCAILPASPSAEEMLNLSSTEQVNATTSTRQDLTVPVVADNNLVSTEQASHMSVPAQNLDTVFDTGI